MALHTLGLHKPNGQAGLGLAPIVPVAPAPLVSRVGAQAGVPREAGTTAAADDLIARVQSGTPGPRRARRLNFKDDPIGAISFALREVGAALQGKELPSAKIAKEEREREAFELKRFQMGLDAVDQFTKLSGKQRAAAAAGFTEKFGEFLGIDFAALSTTVDLDDVLPIVKGIDPSLLVSFGGDPERLRKVALDPQRREILEEISDAKNLGPAMRKIAAAADLLRKRFVGEDGAALAKQRFTFENISQLAGPLGLTGPELAALGRNQVSSFSRLSETTGLNFVATSVLAKEAERPSLESISAEAQARAEGAAEGGKPPAPSVSRDFVLPLLQKRQRGEKLTPDEQAAFDLYSRTGLLDQLIREAMGGAVAGGNPFATDETTRLRQAREALEQGAPRAEVEKRLRDMGLDPSKL